MYRLDPALGATMLAAVFASGCGGLRAPQNAATGAAAATPRSALVQLLTPGGARMGQAVLTATPLGVEVVLTASGLTPGNHGLHIHANGSCAPGADATTGNTVDFGAAGGHFDPGESRKHGRPGDPAHVSHAGDLPNLNADAAGNASMRYVNAQLTLAPGKASVIGRALVVHAGPDDYQTNPAGNSGARVLCGVIEPAQFGSVVG